MPQIVIVTSDTIPFPLRNPTAMMLTDGVQGHPFLYDLLRLVGHSEVAGTIPTAQGARRRLARIAATFRFDPARPLDLLSAAGTFALLHGLSDAWKDADFTLPSTMVSNPHISSTVSLASLTTWVPGPTLLGPDDAKGVPIYQVGTKTKFIAVSPQNSGTTVFLEHVDATFAFPSSREAATVSLSFTTLPTPWYVAQSEEYADARLAFEQDPGRVSSWLTAHAANKLAAYRSIGILPNADRPYPREV